MGIVGIVLRGGTVTRWRTLVVVLRTSARVDTSVTRVRQLRDAQKSGGIQSAKISSVNRRYNTRPPGRSMNDDGHMSGRSQR
jgi:hypothetical protein